MKTKDFVPEYVEDKFGAKFLNDENGLRHSYNDMPSWISKFGIKTWQKHGKLHRDNGLPAIVYPNGATAYFVDGFEVEGPKTK